MDQVTTEKAGTKYGTVVYDTKFGNTGKVAKSVELGLKETGIQTLCINARDATVRSLKEFDLIAIRAPTQGFTASKQMKESLQKLKNINLSEKYGFAFDIKIDYRLSGSAAKFIEKELVNWELRSSSRVHLP